MNRLQNEASPYLRQHADNPVDWYPWGPEAFARAESENKPVLLSIGYSACHWCHVMAHESFEDDTTAKVMNEHFVNIKVDREERPDVDAIYMEAVQAMSGSGGWPMTVFLTPDAKPFFAGTYFPKEPTQGHPGFVSVLTAVSQAWQTQREEVIEQGTQLQQAIGDRVSLEANPDVDIAGSESQWVKNAIAVSLNEADKTWGGFSSAPKFPHVETLDMLLANNETEAVITTLDAMAAGGIYDQIGGGFPRYSVDAFWMVPHFEKMLYDNAGLLRVYTHAYQLTGEERFKVIAEQIATYVLRDLNSPTGGFYSAEDADSEGEEGKFYTWRIEEIAEVLQDEALTAQVVAWFGMTKAGNFEGSNILHRPNREAWEPAPELQDAFDKLLEARGQRIRPGLDDKVLTEWNAMFIASLAEAGAALGHADWVDRAEVAAQFLVENLRNQDGRWLRSWHESVAAKQLAFASDYAWLINAFVSMKEATGKSKYLGLAVETAEAMETLFADEKSGGYFTNGSDGEALIVRALDLIDSAYAATNGTVARGLARLALMTGDQTFRARAERVIALVADPLGHHPTAFASYLSAVRLLGSTATETVIVGDYPELVKAAQQQFLPGNVLVWGEDDATPLWEGRNDGAYVCRNMACQAPTGDARTMLAALGVANAS